jgi:hypothetical protein
MQRKVCANQCEGAFDQQTFGVGKAMPVVLKKNRNTSTHSKKQVNQPRGL